MIKNFILPKTDDVALNEYFKKMPLWYDMDMLKMYIIGMLTGALITIFVMFMI